MPTPVALTPELVAARASAGPRYTSYPPASDFAPLPAGVVDAELARLGAAGAPVAVYLHVPFCRSLCWYCGCNVVPTRDASRGDGYVDEVVAELATLAARLGARLPLAEVALGGGSPNFLSSPALIRLLDAVGATFAVGAATSRSIELDPRTTTTAQVRALAALGFDRASLGVQDFAEPVQVAINRHQSVAQTAGLISALRDAGIDDVNVDLVYGLPHQTEATLAATLDAVVAMAPTRLAIFGYAHLPARLPHQRLVEASGPIPDARARAALRMAATAHLEAAGYLAVGIDHFARPGSSLARAAEAGQLARSFQGYVARRAEATLGVGVSAISSTPRLHWQAPGDLEAWRAAVLAGEVPVARGAELDADMRLRGAVIEALMCAGEVDLAAVGAGLGVDAPAALASELAALAGSDLAAVDGARVTTTPLGRLLVRDVCQVFDREAARRATPGSPTT